MTRPPQTMPPGGPPDRWIADRGAAGALAISLVLMALLLAGAVALPVTTATIRRQRTQAAADLTALAVLAGSSLAGGEGQPDVAAGQAVARRNDATLVAIDTAGWPLGVHVRVVTGAGLTSTATGTPWTARVMHGTAALRLPAGDP